MSGIRQPAMLNALKTHCQNGHAFEGDNVRILIKRGRPARQCVTCIRQKGRDAHRRRVFDNHTGGINSSYVKVHGMPVDIWKRITLAPDSGCWLWIGRRNRAGYGLTQHGKRYNSTHRFTYELLVGVIPPDRELDHLCRVRHCCNPAHLEPVTHRENVLRGNTFAAANAAKTHCPQGHPYAGKNLGISAGQRWCRQCNSDYKKRLRALPDWLRTDRFVSASLSPAEARHLALELLQAAEAAERKL